MQNKKGNFEKVFLLVVSILAIGISGYLIYMSLGFAEKLKSRSVTAKKEMGEIPTEKVLASIEMLKKKFNWSSPIINNKPVPLNKSILIILKGDQLYDLWVEEPQFRPPMTNSYLVKNNLRNILSPNVGELDPDGDWFTNEEEFLKQSDPHNPQSHPPFTDKLFLKQRITNDYILTLNSNSDPFQVLRTAPEREMAFVASPLPRMFGYKDPITKQRNERFEALKFERKEVPDPRLGTKDVSELTVKDHSTKSDFVLVYREPKNLAEYEALFQYRYGQIHEIQVKKGERFRLPGVPATYKVIDIEEAKAVISQLKEDGSEGPPILVNSL